MVHILVWGGGGGGGRADRQCVCQSSKFWTDHDNELHVFVLALPLKILTILTILNISVT